MYMNSILAFTCEILYIQKFLLPLKIYFCHIVMKFVLQVVDSMKMLLNWCTEIFLVLRNTGLLFFFSMILGIVFILKPVYN